jgi:FG-GAP repeat
LLAALTLQALPALGSFSVPQTEFFDFQATAVDRQGDAVAIANGNILIGRESGNVVRVMNQLTGAITRTLAPSEAGPHGFGRAVATSGPVCAIGSPFTLGTGSVYVMNHTTGRLIRKITEPAATANAHFGQALAMTTDYIAVGAPDQDTSCGSAAGMVFVYSTSTGSLVRSFLASDGAAGDGFGWSVAIYGDTLVVGSPFHDQPAQLDVGKTYVYDLKPHHRCAWRVLGSWSRLCL